MKTENETKLAGPVVRVSPGATSTGKAMVKIVIETDPPAWMTNGRKDRNEVTFFGRSVTDAEKIKPGDFVSITGRSGGRESGDRTYTNIIGDQVTLCSAAADAAPSEANACDDDLGF